jgi:hypothetical protein
MSDAEAHLHDIADRDHRALQHLRRYDDVTLPVAGRHPCAFNGHIGDLALDPQARVGVKGQFAFKLRRQEQHGVPDLAGAADAEVVEPPFEFVRIEKAHAAISSDAGSPA